jgi:hypothetical protein
LPSRGRTRTATACATATSTAPGPTRAGATATATGCATAPRSASAGIRAGATPTPGGGAAPEDGASPGWLPDGEEAGDGLPEDEIDWEPDWGERPADLDGDIEDDAPPLARASQAGEPSEEDAFAEEEAAAEAEDLAAEAGESSAGEDCRAALRIGALVHEATSDLGASGRRLTRLRLVT